MKRTARGDLVWPVFAVFLGLGLWQGVTGQRPQEPIEVQSFAAVIEDADPFQTITEWK